MKLKYPVRLSLALAASLAAFAVVGSGVALASTLGKVSVRVEGLKKPLRDKKVEILGGAFTRQGYAIKYPTALGALDVATRGDWQGTYDSEYSEWEVTSILGESHPFSSKYFWAIYVNNVLASSGADQIAVTRGEKLVFAVLPDSDYDEDLIGVTTPAGAKGHAVDVHVVYYDSSGVSHPLAGATVKFGKQVSVSNAAGLAKVVPKVSGNQPVIASKAGYVRDETVCTVAK